jgi:hypothetical protein
MTQRNNPSHHQGNLMASTRRTFLKSAPLVLAAAGLLSMPAFAADTIKVGVLHSLSGTMAISETSLKDVALMPSTRSMPRAACWARSWNRWWWTRPPTGRCLPKRRVSC